SNRLEAGQNQLGDAVAVLDAVARPGAKGTQRYEELAAVVGVYGAVDEVDALAAEAGAGADLQVIAQGRRGGDAGRNEGRVRPQVDVAVVGETGVEVEASGAGGGALGQAGAGPEELDLEDGGVGHQAEVRTEGAGAEGRLIV